MSRYRPIWLGVEDYRVRDFDLFKNLTNHIASLRNLKKSIYNWDEEEFSPMQSFILNKTGLNISFLIHERGPSIIVPDLNENNFLLEAIDKTKRSSKDALILLKKNPSLIGSIDLNNAKVGGVFSKMSCKLLLNPKHFLDGTITNEELASFIIHELGHPFSFFTYLHVSTKVHFAIDQLNKSLAKSAQPTERVQVITELKDLTGLSDLNPKQLSEIKDPDHVGIAFINSFRNQALAQYKVDLFDKHNWEFLSDQFAIKHGAGAAMVSGRIKLGLKGSTFKNHTAIESMKFAALLLGVGSLAVIPAIGFFAAVAWGMDALDKPSIVSGRPHTRLERMRLQMVQLLSDKDLPFSVRHQTREDINIVDDLLKNCQDRLKWSQWLAYNVFGYDKSRLDNEKIALQLERLAHNDLFIRAHDFRDLAQKLI